jgi:hypothetical protein
MSPAAGGKDCIRCFRPMRGSHQKIADHPGTVSYSGRGMCTTCYRIDRDYQPPASRQEASVEHNRASLIAYFRSRGRTITL